MILAVELLRVVSAFMIVWYHTQVPIGHQFSYAGLVIFIILSIFFNLKFDSFSKQVITAFNRIIVPWLFWFLIYGIANVLVGKPFVELNGSVLEAILAGSKIHLWYLPFIFCAIISYLTLMRFMTFKTITIFSGILYIGCVLTINIWREWSLAMGPPIAQYFHAIPAVLLGGVFATYKYLEHKQFNMMLLGLLLVTYSAISIKGFGVPFMVAIVLVYMSIIKLNNVKFTEKILLLSKQTYGIYLVHPIFLFVVSKVNNNLGYLMPLAVFICSFLAVFVFKLTLPKLANKVT